MMIKSGATKLDINKSILEIDKSVFNKEVKFFSSINQKKYRETLEGILSFVFYKFKYADTFCYIALEENGGILLRSFEIKVTQKFFELINSLEKNTVIIPETESLIGEAKIDFVISYTNQSFSDTLLFNIHETDEKIIIEAASSSSSWPKWRISEMLESCNFLITSIADILEEPLNTISILSPAQQRWLGDWNTPKRNQIKNLNQTISECINEITHKQPAAVAIIAEDRCLTYAELDYLSNLAATRLSQLNISSNEVIALLGDKTWEIIVVMLGILKIGAVYLPLNPTDPAARIQDILRESGANLAIIDKKYQDVIFKSVAILSMDFFFQVDNAFKESAYKGKRNAYNPDSLAYLIYTSGSTGKPKGVSISHAAVMNTLQHMRLKLNLCPKDKVLCLSKLGFDLSVFDIFGSLISGASVVLLNDQDSQNPEAWLEIIRSHKVTIWNSVPALMALLVEYIESLPNALIVDSLTLRWVVLSGDKISENLPEKIKRNIHSTCRVLALGGSTEASIWSIGSEVTNWDSSHVIPYGKPFENQSIYIVDDHGFILPPGATGEIAIGGKGLAKEYYKDPHLTSLRFQYIDKIGRIFRTRDSGQINSQNSLAMFMGRLDKQTKVNGNRIDLIEIEKNLTKIDSIELAVVINHKDQNDVMKLSAFLKQSPKNSRPTNVKIRTQLSVSLPASMIPDYYIWLDYWPLTSNGKLDTKSLEKMTLTKPAINNKLIPKLTPKSKSLDASQNSISIHHPPHILATPMNLEGMLYEVIKGAPNTYSFLISVTYDNHLDTKLFHEAWQKVFETNDVLRQSYSFSGPSKTAKIIFNTISKIPYKYFDWSSIDHTETEAWLYERKFQLITHGFNPFCPPLFNVEHFCLPDGQDKILICCNHLLFDAVSTTYILEQLHSIYRNITPRFDFQKNNISYREYLKWRQALDISKYKNFWLKELENIEEASLITKTLEEMTEKISNTDDSQLEMIFLPISAAEKSQIKKFCRDNDLSLVTFFQSCWSLLLSFWLNQLKIISGLVYSGKSQIPEDWKKLPGVFINTLPLIIDVDPKLTFFDWMKKVGNNIQRLKDYDILSLAEINQLTDSKISVYFDSIFTAFNFPRPDLKSTIKIKNIEYRQVTHFPLTIQFDPVEMEIGLGFLSKNLNKKINSIAQCYHWLIRQGLFCAEKEINKLSLIPPHNDFFNQSGILYGSNDSNYFDVIESFNEASKIYPQKLACVCEDKEYTYSQLAADINSLSIYLREEKIVAPLALMFPRSYEFIVAVMACLHSNITFMPLDMDLPEIDFQKKLKQARCCNILTTRNKIIKNHEIYTDFNSIPKLQSKIAYILFTSGSAGKPKGVKIPRSALNNNISALIKLLEFKTDDTIFSMTSVTFDIVLLELLMPLCSGGTLLLPSTDKLFEKNYLDMVSRRYLPTYLQTTPSRWTWLLENNISLSSLQYILVGGETLSQSLFEKLASAGKNIINLYGPTEATIWTTLAYLNKNDSAHIGTPIPNTWCVVLNQFNQILPFGIAGELCIGGDGLASEYLDPEQTKASFISLEIFPGCNKKIYKTGDKVWIDNNGLIHFLGREDRQLKIRGQRIEPAEIETKILQTQLVKNVVVAPSPLDSQSLIAYVETYKRKIKKMDISLFCFPEDSNNEKNIFDFYLRLAQCADKLSLSGMWIPERHFDKVGAPFSAPAVVVGALAAITQNLVLGAGSIVLPLHNPINILEQWATLDCISKGRIRFSVASGWHPDDFILAPDNYNNRKKVMFEKLEILKQAWKSGKYTQKNGTGNLRTVNLFPKPVQAECPLWVTVADDVEVFAQAGRLGLNILTHLLMQDINELESKLLIYRHNLVENGFEPAQKQVTVMIHTYINSNPQLAVNRTRAPLIRYFKSHVHLLKKIQTQVSNKEDISEEYLEKLTDRFIGTKSLIGTPKECEKLIAHLYQAGVNEIACLIDFGLPQEQILEGLEEISKLHSAIPNLLYQKKLDIDNLRKKLKEELPAIMIPSNFLLADEIPLTLHGKIDYKKLQSISIDIKNKPDNFNALIEKRFKGDALANQLLVLWKKALRQENIDPTVSFFDSGGHSLRAVELLSKIDEEFQITTSLGDFLNNPYLENLINLVRNKNGSPQILNHDPITENSNNSKIPLTPMQKGIWVFNYFFPEANCYNDTFLYEVDLSINPEKLAKTLQAVFDEDPIFKVSFFNKNEILEQKIMPAAPRVNSINYMRPISGKIENEIDFWNTLQSLASYPFQLNQAPLIQAMIYQFTNKTYLQLVIHHILTDGKSIYNIMQRLENKILNHSTLNQNLPNYFDFAKEYSKKTNLFDASASHYINKMRLTNLKNTLKNNLSAEAKRTFKGFQKNIVFTQEEILLLEKIASQVETSLNNVLLTIYTKTLLSWINEDTIQIGSAISIREKKWQGCIGLFVNFGVIAINNQDAKDWSPITWLSEIKNRSIFLLENRHVSFSAITGALGAKLLLDTQPVFQFAFNAFSFEMDSINLFHHQPIDYGISRFGLELQASVALQKINLTFIFSSDIFSSEDASDFIEDFKSQIVWLTKLNQINFSSNNTSIEFNKQITSYWRFIYDDLYRNISDLNSQHWLGWNNSIDGVPFGKDFMDEWLKDIASKIMRQPLNRVLEIGCGTGSIIKAIKQKYNFYLGIDFSSEIIDKLRMQHESQNTYFEVMEASSINRLKPRTFDTIILNSVIQYFPNQNYLEEIIEKTVELLLPEGGRIIIGDIRNMALQEEFYQYIQSNQSCNLNKKSLIKCFETEKELFVEPEFFYKLYNQFTNLTAVFLEPKYLDIKNEVSNYRCDLTLCFSNKTSFEHANNVTLIDACHIKSIQEFYKMILNNEKNIQHYSLLIINLYNARISPFVGFDPVDLYQTVKKINIFGKVLIDPKNPKKLMCYLSDNESNNLPMLKLLERITARPSDNINLTSTEHYSEGFLTPKKKIIDSPSIRVKLSKIWVDLLGCSEVESSSNFFQLGGNSMLYIMLLNRIIELGYSIKISDILPRHTLSEQVDFLMGLKNAIDIVN